MRMERFHKSILFISSYIPLYLLLIIKDIVGRIEKYGVGQLKKAVNMNSLNDVMIVILFLISAASFLYLLYMVKTVRGKAFILIKEIRDETSSNFLNYISIYLLSCMGLSLGTYEDITVLIFVMIIIGYIYTRSNMVYINPVLNVLGYDIYNITGIAQGTGEEVNTFLVAKKKLYLKKGDLIYSTKITSFAFALTRK